jgi:ABC-2 type transport system permease protein
MKLDRHAICALTWRTFRNAVESPIAFIVAIFFYGFVGWIFGQNFFVNKQASISGVGFAAPWVLWLIVPALTMGLISEEIRSGTFEHLATLPLRDWEIVLGKFFGFALLALCLTLGLVLYPVLVSLVTAYPQGIDGGATVGVLAGIFFMALCYGAMGLFASSLTRNQVVALILGMIFCTFFFLISQFYAVFPGALGRVADYVGMMSHVNSLARGVWDLRDLLYFFSVILFFLFATVQRLATRRF